MRLEVKYQGVNGQDMTGRVAAMLHINGKEQDILE